MLLEVIGLKKSYGKRIVVDDVSLMVKEREVVGLLGPNGAGKTTTFYMIVGMIKPDSGKIIFDGEDITSWPFYKRAQKGIGYLPQEPSIFRKLTVWENIASGLEFKGFSEDEVYRKVAEIVSIFGLERVKDQYAYVLSGGERRRVEVARAISLNPRVLLLDEPFTGLDPVTIAELKDLITFMKEKFGVGILITDHNARETLRITDRAYIINNGNIIAHGTPEEIVALDEVRRVYLGEEFVL